MSFVAFLPIFLSGVSLAVDAFAVSITDGMVYRDLSKSKGVLIPLTFGLFQSFMPIVGFYISMLLSQINFFEQIDHWVAFALLLIIGGKMIFDGIKERKLPQEEVKQKKFSMAEVLTQGVATSIDALAVGFSLTAMLDGVKNIQLWAWISVAVIGITTFAIVVCGLLIGVKVGHLFKKKTWIAELIGGVVLILIGVKIVVGSYVKLPF